MKNIKYKWTFLTKKLESFIYFAEVWNLIVYYAEICTGSPLYLILRNLAGIKVCLSFLIVWLLLEKTLFLFHVKMWGHWNNFKVNAVMSLVSKLVTDNDGVLYEEKPLCSCYWRICQWVFHNSGVAREESRRDSPLWIFQGTCVI